MLPLQPDEEKKHFLLRDSLPELFSASSSPNHPVQMSFSLKNVGVVVLFLHTHTTLCSARFFSDPRDIKATTHFIFRQT